MLETKNSSFFKNFNLLGNQGTGGGEPKRRTSRDRGSGNGGGEPKRRTSRDRSSGATREDVFWKISLYQF